MRRNAAYQRYLEDQANQNNPELGQTTRPHPDRAAGFEIGPHAEIKGLLVTERAVAEVVAKWVQKPLADIFYE